MQCVSNQRGILRQLTQNQGGGRDENLYEKASRSHPGLHGAVTQVRHKGQQTKNQGARLDHGAVAVTQVRHKGQQTKNLMGWSNLSLEGTPVLATCLPRWMNWPIVRAFLEQLPTLAILASK